MTAGRKPPIMPPRNPLAAATGKIGKRPPLPFHMALQQMRDRQRLQKHGNTLHQVLAAGGNDRAQRLPFDPRAAARQALTGSAAEIERGRAKAGRKVREAQGRVADEIRRAAAGAGEVATAPEAPAQPDATNRPPHPAAGRYDGLKDGRPA